MLPSDLPAPSMPLPAFSYTLPIRVSSAQLPTNFSNVSLIGLHPDTFWIASSASATHAALSRTIDTTSASSCLGGVKSGVSPVERCAAVVVASPSRRESWPGRGDAAARIRSPVLFSCSL
ncbi:Uncharacterised protein [Mycobacteroides abscessus subsp. abscessus]|nr:Uncharacterised protein [Mycobacteroides abscessus subsp. abscessus]